MTAPHVTRYELQLLQLICDKLEIDYSEQKAKFLKANEEAKVKAKAREEKHEQRMAKFQALASEKLPSQIQREQQDAEIKRLQSMTYDQIKDLKAQYIHADQSSQAAWDAYLTAACNDDISVIDRDKVHDEWQWHAQRAHALRKSLKIAEAGIG